MSKKDPKIYAIATTQAKELYEMEEGYKVSKDAIEVRQLKKGDVLHGTGVEILNISAGVSTPQGKMDVTVRYPNGKEQTNQWWKTTKVVVKRAPETPEQELETLKRIWSRTPQEKWPDALKSKIADLESKVSNMQEGFSEVNDAYSDILGVYNKRYIQLSNINKDDAYALHELLKEYFNRLFEGAIEEPSSEVKKGDVLKHKNSEVELEITNIVYNDKGGVRLYRGKITNAGTISGVEAVGKIYQIRPTLVGSTWFVKEKEQSVTENLDNYSKDAITDMIINLSRYEGTEELIADLKKILKQRNLGKLKKEQLSEETYESIETYTDASALARRLSRTEVGTFYIFEVEKTIREFIVSKEPIAGAELAGAFLDGKPVVDNTLQEAKEEGYESPKPELPLDVLHHGIRFELDKKEIGNTPTQEEYMKAYKAATKNLEKDLLHYKREEGAEDAPVSKSDEMIKVKLKESFKNIIRNILSESASDKKAFNLNGKVI